MKKKIQFLSVFFSVLLFALSSCKKDNEEPATQQTDVDISEKGTNPDEQVINDEQRHRLAGYLYTEGNEAGTNNIHIYRQHSDGHLTHESSVASGGAGNAAGLGSQGAVALSDNHHWLFAVNAGDNSVSSFEVHADGMLTLANTVSSGGATPVSLCVQNHLLYVVNAGSSDISGYVTGPGGTMTPIAGSILPLSAANAGPAQIAFSPNGHYLYVTEKMTNSISSYEISTTGSATFDNSFPSTGVTPFGFSFVRDRFMVVSNANGGAPNGSSCTSYHGINPGNLAAVNGSVPNNQTAACWVATSQFGRFAYVTNTGSDNISSYYVGHSGALYLIHASAASTQSHPIDICIAANNYYIYNLNAMSHSITGYRRGLLGNLIANGSISGVPDFAAGLVAW